MRLSTILEIALLCSTAIAPESLARVRFLLLFSKSFLPVREKIERSIHVNPARTANDKQRRRAVYAFRAEYWGCLAARLRGAPRIPEACWIASQTHSLLAPLCYCCQGGGAGRRALYRRRGRETRALRPPDDFFPSAKELSFPPRREHATRFRAYKGSPWNARN